MRGEGYTQALALHKRTRALKWQKAELERDIAEATEAGDGEAIPGLMLALSGGAARSSRGSRTRRRSSMASVFFLGASRAAAAPADPVTPQRFEPQALVKALGRSYIG